MHAIWTILRQAPVLVAGSAIAATGACGGHLVRRTIVDDLNLSFSGRVYQARRDLEIQSGPEKEVVFPKGTRLRIWLEGRPEWVKLRAYKAEVPREQARGAPIVYIFLEDLTPEAEVAAESEGAVREYLALKRLMNGMADNLQAADQKEAPKRR